MRKRMLCVLAVLTVICRLPVSASAADITDFKDVSETGWSYPYLERAVQDGLLVGYSSDTLAPRAPVTVAQMCAILTRVLRLTDASSPAGGSAWYEPYMRAAWEADVVKSDCRWTPGQTATRAMTFLAVCSAFQLERPDVSLELLDPFPDMAYRNLRLRRVTASLVDVGLLFGDDQGRMNPGSPISREEFVAILYRAVSLVHEADVIPDASETAVLYDAAEFALADRTVSYDTLLTAGNRTVSLRGVTYEGSLAVRSARLESLELRDSHIETLVLGVLGGSGRLAPENAAVDRLIIGQNRVAVTVDAAGRNQIDRVWVTGDGQTVTLNGTFSSLTVTGNDNTIVLPAGSTVDRLTVDELAAGNQIRVEGEVRGA